MGLNGVLASAGAAQAALPRGAPARDNAQHALRADPGAYSQ